MASPDLAIHLISDGGDERGSSFSFPGALLGAIASVEDMHITTLAPGGIRGNHYHVARNEILIVLYKDSWSLHWDTGEGSVIERRTFSGDGAALLAVPPLASHAIRNDGVEYVQIVALSDGLYDPEYPDSFPRAVAD
jgi:dTDP-4-dehydrorhamnose 3,5-epimerase-like enzyme